MKKRHKREHFSTESEKYKKEVEKRRVESSKERLRMGEEYVRELEKENPDPRELRKNLWYVRDDFDLWADDFLNPEYAYKENREYANTYLSYLFNQSEGLRNAVEDMVAENGTSPDDLENFFINNLSYYRYSDEVLKELLKANLERRNYVENEVLGEDFKDDFLENVDELRNRGFLSDEQYQNIKARLNEVQITIGTVLDMSRFKNNITNEYHRESDEFFLMINGAVFNERVEGELTEEEYLEIVATHEMLHAVSGMAVTKYVAEEAGEDMYGRQVPELYAFLGKDAGLRFEQKFDEQPVGRALNEGVTEYLTRKFSGIELSDVPYQKYVKLIEYLVDDSDIPEDVLIGAYFESYRDDPENEHALPKTKKLFNLFSKEFGSSKFYFLIEYADRNGFFEGVETKKDIEEKLGLLEDFDLEDKTLNEIKGEVEERLGERQ